jgi:hypothetical protein
MTSGSRRSPESLRRIARCSGDPGSVCFAVPIQNLIGAGTFIPKGSNPVAYLFKSGCTCDGTQISECFEQFRDCFIINANEGITLFAHQLEHTNFEVGGTNRIYTEPIMIACHCERQMLHCPKGRRSVFVIRQVLPTIVHVSTSTG